jgi:CheY-like chemotaxis protein
MKRVVLIHFNEDDVPRRMEQLRRAGHQPEYVAPKDFRSLKTIRADPPDAVVIDFARLPSHGKEVAMALQQYAATRTVPIVFIEGDPAKTDKVRSAVPGAVFTTWENAAKVIEAVKPVPAPVRVTGTYSGTSLPKKLGIREASKVMTIASPDGFEEMLEPMPEGAEFVRTGTPDVLIVFTTTQAELELRFAKALSRVGEKTKLWMAWPKKTSGVQSDLNEDAVRNFGLGIGWVDYKVCAIDNTWSGLALAPKKDAGASGLRHAAPREELAAKKTNAR